MNKIANLKPGDDGVYIEALINHVVSGKTNGTHRSTYLSMTLQDDTGSIDAKLWNATDEQVQNLVKGTVVQIKGDVIKYNEDRQMKIVKIHTGTQDDKERIRFLKQAPLDGQFMIHEIKKFIDQIDNLKLHQLVKTLFEENIEKLKQMLKGKTTSIAGPSGVGKSSLINLLQSGVQMETGSISRKIARGKHTTRHSELIMISPDSYIMDTPGFSSLYVNDFEKEELKYYFPEFSPYEGKCRFNGCDHIHEPGCAVKEAVESGAIHKIRYEDYTEMYRELKEKKRY